jgi:HlyD family secretion protein
MNTNRPSDLQTPASGASSGAEYDALAGSIDDPDGALSDTRPPRSSRVGWWISGIVLLALVSGLLLWLRHGAQAATPRNYKTSEASRGDVIQTVTASGQISPVKTVTVGCQVSGQITALYADYNSEVTNGQLIAQLETSTYEQSLIQAEADVASAQAALKLQELTYNRAKTLDEAKAKPHAELETAEADLEQARAALKSKQAALKKAQVDLEHTTIYSPIDGVVITRAVDVGQTVTAAMNTPTLFTLAKDLRQMQIQASVSEADIGGVKAGLPSHFTVDAYSSATFTGRVSLVRYEATTNQNVVTYATIIDAGNDELKLRPGMTANVTIITAECHGALRISNAALRFMPPADALAGNAPLKAAPGTHVVYVVQNGPGPAARLAPTLVRTGISDGGVTEILEGLQESDQVATGINQNTAAVAANGGNNPFGMPKPPGRH